MTTRSVPSPASSFKAQALNLISVLIFCTSLSLSSALHAGVYISEFMADNSAGLRTASGALVDWIELGNNGPAAVDVGGWYLTDSKSNLKKWSIPAGTSIPGYSHIIIFADTSEVSVTNGQLHANFSLSKDGEYLALVQPDGVNIVDEFAPEFPPQFENISYGHSVQERDLLTGGSSVRYQVPTAGGPGPWALGTGALGFTGTNGLFSVSYYEVIGAIDNIDVAESMVANPGMWKTDRPYPLLAQHASINFFGTDSPGAFGADQAFPGHSAIGEDRENFILTARGTIYVPTAGQWTFAVGSDDGFRLRISGHGADFVCEYTTGRGFDATLGTFNFPVAGAYDLQLTYYENFGGSGLELSSAPGFLETFSPGSFLLVGDPLNPIRHAGDIGSVIDTDVSQAMRGVNSRLDGEWEFVWNQATQEGDTLALSVLAADGFVASLNGTRVAALNAPDPLLWNSTATAARPAAEALTPSTFVLPASLLRLGTNTLSISALNNTASDTEFLIQPLLALRTSQNASFYYRYPTPRSSNSRGYTAPTPKVTISEPRGYRTQPFTVTISSTDTNAQIRYTLDGSVPRTNSALYTGPINISKTTTLRAAVVDPATIRQTAATTTWLFLEDILHQGSTPPPGWPANRQVNNHLMEYGMLQTIVNSDGQRLRQGMTNAIPSISIVTDLANLFNAQTGIYVNPGNDGRSWERPVSVELIDPVNGKESEFRIDAGLRIRGAFSRSSSNPKHSFRLFFRSDYGEDKLRFRLFGEEGASEFEKVDLRTSQNYSWAYENGNRDTFVRETFSRDSQRDMGMPYTRSRYYHLYLNGQYWGLYQTQERGDADYAETYLGGEDSDWDCIKTTQPGYTTTASDGTFTAFNNFHNIAINQGFTGVYSNNYFRVKGLNPNGTTNAAYPVYLDEDNLIVYMMNAYYAGDPDSPISIWGGMPNNMYALFNRVAPDGFKWLRHDAEHSLGVHSGYPVTCDTTGSGTGFTAQSQFNPATLHMRLCAHPQYRLRFADLVQKHLYGDGALTPTNAQKRFLSRMNEIDLAIIGESARWGRGKTRDATWLPECNRVLNTYLNQRRDIVIGQFRNRGWFPSIDAPSYSLINTQVPAGGQVRLSAPGTFYYTLDGSDPRMADGSINPAAMAVSGSGGPVSPRTLITTGATWRYFDKGSEPATAGGLNWRQSGFSDTSWSQGPGILGFAGSGTANQVATTTRRYVTGSSGPQVTTTYLRHTFSVQSTNGLGDLLINVLRDDGVVVYLNGTEILRDNMNSGTPSYDTYSSAVVGSPDQNTYFSYTVKGSQLLRNGTNVLAVELHQANSGSSDLYFDFSLTALPNLAQVFTNVTINKTVTVKARAFSGSEWSALSENQVTVIPSPVDYSHLRVSELMYAPPSPPVGSPYDADDFAWLELRNFGATSLGLAGVNFTAGITHTFGELAVPAGGRLVVAKNIAAFATRYPTNDVQIVQWESGNLARRGETLSLADALQTNIFTFTYTNAWYPETFNTGISLVAQDLSAPAPVWSEKENWRAAWVPFGTPGRPEPPRLSAAKLTQDGKLAFSVEGLEGAVELWFAPDLEHWDPCPAAAWSLVNSVVTVDLDHPSLAPAGRTFFRLKMLE